MNGKASSPHPSRAAINALAERFGLPNEEWIQDWEYEVADPQRIDEFLSYAETRPGDEEALVVMMILFQSFEGLGEQALHDPRWERVVTLLHDQYALHRSSIQHWSSQGEKPENWWQITPLIRLVIASRDEGSVPLA